MGNVKIRAAKRPLKEEYFQQGTATENDWKELVDKGVQKYPEMIEENTSMSSFPSEVISPEPPKPESPLANMLNILSDQDVISLTDLMLATDEETFLGLLMDDQTFKEMEYDANDDLQQYLSQLLVELEANAFEDAISWKGTTKKTEKRFSFSESPRDIPMAKRRRFENVSAS